MGVADAIALAASILKLAVDAINNGGTVSAADITSLIDKAMVAAADAQVDAAMP